MGFAALYHNLVPDYASNLVSAETCLTAGWRCQPCVEVALHSMRNVAAC